MSVNSTNQEMTKIFHLSNSSREGRHWSCQRPLKADIVLFIVPVISKPSNINAGDICVIGKSKTHFVWILSQLTQHPFAAQHMVVARLSRNNCNFQAIQALVIVYDAG